MSRTPSQLRYSKKRLRTVTGVQVRQEELEYLRRERAKTGWSWLELMYRGLGQKRIDYLNSRKNTGSVP